MKLIALLLLSGCASNLSVEDREWREGIDRENWQMCDSAYNRARVVVYHMDHRHGRNAVWWQIKSDLVHNHCRKVLGKYYAEY